LGIYNWWVAEARIEEELTSWEQERCTLVEWKMEDGRWEREGSWDTSKTKPVARRERDK